MRALGLDLQIRGFTPLRVPGGRAPEQARMANMTAELLGLDLTLDPAEISNSDSHMGPAYAAATPDGIEAIKLLARTEGVFPRPRLHGEGLCGAARRRAQRCAHRARRRGVRSHRRYAAHLRLRRGAQRRLGRRRIVGHVGANRVRRARRGPHPWPTAAVPYARCWGSAGSRPGLLQATQGDRATGGYGPSFRGRAAHAGMAAPNAMEHALPGAAGSEPPPPVRPPDRGPSAP